jgi:hypothetical protein
VDEDLEGPWDPEDYAYHHLLALRVD